MPPNTLFYGKDGPYAVEARLQGKAEAWRGRALEPRPGTMVNIQPNIWDASANKNL